MQQTRAASGNYALAPERADLKQAEGTVKMKKLLAAAIALPAVVAFMSPAAAQETDSPSAITLSGSAAVTSQYRFRGISLSDEDVAVQAGLTAAHQSGFYIGTWGSNLAGFGTFGGSNVELDVYGGYKTDLGAAALDVGLLWYLYPGTDNTDFAEVYASITGALGPATVKLGAAYAPEQDAAILTGTDNIYVYTDASVGVPNSPLTLKAHLGYSDGGQGNGLSPTGNYIDWLVGADVVYKNLTLGVAYVDTDIGRASAAAAAFDRGIADAAVVVTLGATF